MGKGLEMEKRGCCCWESWLPRRDAWEGSVKEAERRLACVRPTLGGARARQTDRQDGSWNGWDLLVQYCFLSLEHLAEATRSTVKSGFEQRLDLFALRFPEAFFAAVVCLFFCPIE